MFSSEPAQALFDFVGKSIEDRAKAAAYASAVADLATEIDESSSLALGAHELAEKQAELDQKAREVESIARETKSLSARPDWASQRLEETLRYTQRTIRRAKSLLVRIGLVGTDVATAMNTAETNMSLNEVVKNQQAQLLMQKEAELKAREHELRTHEQWNSFIETERARRNVQ